MADTEQNKSLILKYFELMNAQDLDGLAAVTAADVRNHSAVPEAQGREGVRTIVSKLFKAMPDHKVSCEDLLADGDKVVCRVRVTGTQTGPLDFTRFPLPATGKAVSTEQIHIFRIQEGKIVEHWMGRDDVGMLRQLGHLPTRAS